MASDMVSVSGIIRRSRKLAVRFERNDSGLAGIEFSFILPVMLVMLFGMIDAASGVAIKRKVTLTARSLSDLVSRGTSVADTDVKNFFGLGTAIMSPYSVSPATIMTQKITQLSVDASKKVKVVWSKSGTFSGSTVTVTTGYSPGETVTTVPANLLVPNTYLIWSEVNYNYTPITGYIAGTAAIPLYEQTFTRPRQSDCVIYSPAASC